MKNDVNGNIVFVSFRFFLPENHRHFLISVSTACILPPNIYDKKNPRLEVHKEFLKFAVLN